MPHRETVAGEATRRSSVQLQPPNSSACPKQHRMLVHVALGFFLALFSASFFL